MIPLSSRRTFIKGLPAGLAGLAVISPFWDRLIRRAHAEQATQQRLLVWYVPDGTVPEWFWPSTTGALTIRSDRTDDLSSRTFNDDVPSADRPTFVLQPVASYADRITLVKGLNNPGTGDHVLSIQSCLTGEAARAGATGTSVSLDVLMSEANVKSHHALPVLRTGSHGPATRYTGSSDLCRPRNNNNLFIQPSWQPTNDARALLDAVGGVAPPTGGTTGPTVKSRSRLAALGAVRARVEALRCSSGTPAAQRLEAYLAEIARLERLEQEMRPTTPPFETTLNPDDSAIKAAQGDLARFLEMAPFIRELVATAFALDYTPCVTLQWAASGINKISGSTLTDYRYNALANVEYRGAGEHGNAHPENSAFQDAGHNITAASATRDRVRFRRWYFEQMKLVLDRFASIPDGSGTLLDHTTILHVSEFGGPNANSTRGQHSNSNLPYMLVAGSETPFRTGQSLTVSGRNHGDFLLTLAKGFGSTATTMGVGTTPIDEVLR